MKGFPKRRLSYTLLSPLNKDIFGSKPTSSGQNHAMMSNATEVNRRGLLLTPTGEMAANLLDVNPDDLLAHGLIEELLTDDKLREFLTAPFLQRQKNEGEVVIGEDPFTRTPQRQAVRDLTNSIAVGTPGSGKTTLVCLVAIQLAIQGIYLLLIDSEKEELRNLAPIFARYDILLRVLNCRTLAWNPLEPPEGVDPFEFVEHAALSIGAALELAEPGVRLLKEVIYQLYLERGVFEGSKDYPVLHEAREVVAKHRISNQLTREAVLARLDTVLINTPGLRFRRGVSSKDLSGCCSILECAGMSSEARDLLISSIIVKEFLRRKAQGNVNVPIDWAVFIDDAQRICANPDGHLARSINTIRSTGIVFNLSVQSARQVAPAIFSNTQTKFCGILASADESQFMARSMGASSYEQTQYLATKLERGQFLCQLGNGWRDPHLVEVHPDMIERYLPPPPSIPKRLLISDSSSKHESPSQTDLGTNLVEAKEYRNWIPPEWASTSINQKQSKQAKESGDELTAREQEFLDAVIQSPGRPCSSYSNNVSFSQKVAISVRKGLVEKGFLHEEHVQTQRLGRTAKLLTLTQTAKTLLARVRKEKE